MKPYWKLLIILGCLLLLVAGCASASHLKALQPPSVPRSSPIALPAPSPSVTTPAAQPFLRGIDIDWYTWPAQDVVTDAQQTIRYIVSLHANAVSISFPFFMNGNASGSIHVTSATPSPTELGVLIADAKRAGLYVSLRPLLDEASLDVGRVGGGRVGYAPARPAAWFAGYQRFLAPYLALAQRAGADQFIIGTELDAMNLWPQWNALDAWARTLYQGQLACADNWSAIVRHGCGRGVTQTIDAYAPQRVPALASWTSWDQQQAHGDVLTEVGIAAAPAAFSVPWRVNWPVTQVAPGVQSRWFTAACMAAVATHLGGIYFWSVGVGAPGHGPTLSAQGSWSGGPGATAISSCFDAIERA